MAPKLKQANGQASTMGSSSAESYSLPGGVFSLSQPELPEVLPRDGRKKRKGVLSRDKYTLTPYFDGHLWRKYGQKRIKNSPFPRLYFRCSYNEDKHCMASKLIQQVSHDYPPMYKVTYTYEHTCNAAPIPAPDVVAEAELPAASDGLVLRFGSYGSSHRDARMKQQERRREYNQPMSNWSPFELLGFDSGNSQLQQQLVLSSEAPPPAAGSSSSSFSLGLVRFYRIQSGPERSI